MPKEDFVQLGIQMAWEIQDFKHEGFKMVGDSPCEFYHLGNLTITIDQMDYVIPPSFYAATSADGKCHFLFSINNHEEPELKDKYILGLPFLKAFIVVLDYERNSIGFANKVQNFGAEILGADAPGPKRKYYEIRDFEKDESSETFVPVDGKGNPTDGYGWKRPTSGKWSPPLNVMKVFNNLIWGSIVSIIILLVIKYAKLQKSKTFD